MSDQLANRMRISAIARAECEESALSDGDNNTMWESAWSMVSSINSRLAAGGPIATDAALLDIDMHDLWHNFWHGAVNSTPYSPNLDRLAMHIIQLREQGIQKGPDQSSILTSNGSRLWTELPFLVEDMTAHWMGSCATMSSAQRLSGALFLAILAAAGTDPGDLLCGIALATLREALETPRPLGRLTATDRDKDRQMRDLTIADLLPSVNAWLFTAGRKIIQLSDAGWDRHDDDDDIGKLGALAILEDIDPAPASPLGAGGSSFSARRWIWWLQRLEQIAALAAQQEAGADTQSLATFAECMKGNMAHFAAQTTGKVSQALCRREGAVRHRPAMQLLGPPRAVPGLEGAATTQS